MIVYAVVVMFVFYVK